MAALSIHLLGTFHVSYRGRRVDGFRTDRERALLAFLAVERSRPQRRETLMDLLWPDLSGERARNNLRVNLHRLRKTLARATGQKDWLLVGRDSVQINQAADVGIDADAFEAHRTAAQRLALEQRPTAAERLHHLVEAGNVYRGDFLQGFALKDTPVFDQWARQVREKWHRAALETLHELCAMHIRRGELREALTAARRQLELEPWREEAHRQMMDILARRGERSAALAQFKQCRETLRDELAIEPGEQTRNLARRIERLGPDRVRNLPALSTAFVGRKVELDQIATRLSDPGCRLLTLVGPGGSGKTRLAAAAAEHLAAAFLDGVCFVPLDTADEAGEIAALILDALDLPLVDPSHPLEQLHTYLKQRELLLVLDNCEHLIPAIRDTLSQLLAAPDVKLLATSRERLGGAHETVLFLGGLTVDAKSPPVAYSAGRLFLEQARRHQPRLALSEENAAAITRICQMLDGMPLALLLAASWLSVLSVREVADELQRDLGLLATTPVTPGGRQQNLDLVFGQSWSRLTDSARRTLSRLSVFVGPFDRHAAEAVAGATLTDLTELVNKALVQRSGSGSSSASEFTLHALIRRFAADKLRADPGAVRAVQDRFVSYYTRFLEERKPLLLGPDHLQAVNEVLEVYPNVRAAIKLACQLRDFAAIGRSLYPLLGTTYMSQISLTTAKTLFGEIVRAVETTCETIENASVADKAVFARALLCEAWFSLHTGEREFAKQQLHRALSLAENSQDFEVKASILNALGILARRRGSFTAANELFQEALEIVAVPDSRYGWWQHGSFHNQLGISYAQQGKLTEARAYFERGRHAFEAAESALGLNVILRGLGDLSLKEGEHELARTYYEAALETTRRLGSPVYEARVLVRLGRLALLMNETEQADKLFEQAQHIAEELGFGMVLQEMQAFRATT